MTAEPYRFAQGKMGAYGVSVVTDRRARRTPLSPGSFRRDDDRLSSPA
jgi:hypothetical protein